MMINRFILSVDAELDVSGAMMGEQRDPKRPTIHDVARSARVSAATVSKVMRGVTTVKAENAARVREAIDRLGYRVDPIAAGLRKEQRRIIGAIVPDLESPFFGALVTGLEKAAEEANYSLIVASSRECEEREAKLVERMHEWRVAGTVLVPVRSEAGKGAAVLSERGMCAVLADRVSANDRYDTVTADNYAAAGAVADFLAPAGHGHVLVHGSTRQSKSIRTRLEGFQDRARILNPAVLIDVLVSDEDIDAQRDAIRSYFSLRQGTQMPTAIFTLQQQSTLLVLSELRRMGARIPQDVALVGFDDAEWMRITWPTITAVSQPVEAIARRAADTLLARIEKKMTGFPVQFLEACKIRERESAKADVQRVRQANTGPAF